MHWNALPESISIIFGTKRICCNECTSNAVGIFRLLLARIHFECRQNLWIVLESLECTSNAVGIFRLLLECTFECRGIFRLHFECTANVGIFRLLLESLECTSNAVRIFRLLLESLECTSNAVGIFRLLLESLECTSNAVGIFRLLLESLECSRQNLQMIWMNAVGIFRLLLECGSNWWNFPKGCKNALRMPSESLDLLECGSNEGNALRMPSESLDCCSNAARMPSESRLLELECTSNAVKNHWNALRLLRRII